MKNLWKLKINPEKLMKDDALISLRGGTENECAPGETKWLCYVHWCFECQPTEGYICATTAYAAELKYWAQYPEAFSVGCEAPPNPE